MLKAFLVLFEIYTVASCRAAEKAHCLPLVSMVEVKERVQGGGTGHIEKKNAFLRAEDCMVELLIGKVGGLREG